MHKTYKKWLEDGCPKVICHCGCNEEVIIKKYYSWYGIPKYIHGHNLKGENHPMFGIHRYGEKAPFFGKHHSKDSIEKISKTRIEKGIAKGENHPMFGKHPSEETIEKISKAKIGKHPSEETIEKISKTRIEKGIAKGQNNPRFNNWSSKGEYCENWTEEVREKVRNKFDRKCYLCVKEEKDNITKNGKQKKLSVHHIDADKEQGCNGKPWKLIPLCLKCHGKVHMHKIKME